METVFHNQALNIGKVVYVISELIKISNWLLNRNIDIRMKFVIFYLFVFLLV